MGRLQDILLAEKAGLEPWEPIPRSRWPVIASLCGAPERDELRARIAKLDQDLRGVEEWDGDVRDDIHRTIEFFQQILQLSDRP